MVLLSKGHNTSPHFFLSVSCASSFTLKSTHHLNDCVDFHFGRPDSKWLPKVTSPLFYPVSPPRLSSSGNTNFLLHIYIRNGIEERIWACVLGGRTGGGGVLAQGGLKLQFFSMNRNKCVNPISKSRISLSILLPANNSSLATSLSWSTWSKKMNHIL